MTVLDASAVLALLHDEAGADMVAEALPRGLLSSVNLAEVVGKLVDLNVDARTVRSLLRAAGVVIQPFTEEDAELCGALRSVSGARALSLGDRACLALALRHEPAEVLTADHAWTRVDLPVRVTLLR